jgi:hypothetical protein
MLREGFYQLIDPRGGVAAARRLEIWRMCCAPDLSLR